MAFNSYDLANTSLVKTGNLTEMYIPLWWYSSGSVSTAVLNTNNFVQKGTNGTTNGTGTNVKLHSLNSNWSPNQKFSFEASISSATGGTAANAALWDFTTNSLVSASQISNSTVNNTLLRSGQFTLTPGHIYGVSLWGSSSTTSYLNKASLIAFLG